MGAKRDPRLFSKAESDFSFEVKEQGQRNFSSHKVLTALRRSAKLAIDLRFCSLCRHAFGDETTHRL